MTIDQGTHGMNMREVISVMKTHRSLGGQGIDQDDNYLMDSVVEQLVENSVQHIKGWLCIIIYCYYGSRSQRKRISVIISLD